MRLQTYREDSDQFVFRRLQADIENWSACVDASSDGQRKLINLHGCAFRRTAKTDQPAWMCLQADSENWSAFVDAPSGGQRRFWSVCVDVPSGGQWKLISLRGCTFWRTAKTDQPSWMRLQADNEDSDQPAWTILVFAWQFCRKCCAPALMLYFVCEKLRACWCRFSWFSHQLEWASVEHIIKHFRTDVTWSLWFLDKFS